jgi:glycosyltransferase involved in cell wall biosynthesis
MNKKIAIIGTNGLPANYGGWETLTEYLTKHLSQEFDITVFCTSTAYKEKKSMHNGAKLKYLSLKANGIQSIPYDIVSIFKSLFFADTLLILGVSGCVILPFIKLISKKKIIVNIDGLEWKRAKWGKATKWFLKLSEKLAVLNSDVVLTDNTVIQDYVKDTYGKDSTLVEYGADHCTKIAISESVQKSFPFLSERYAFKVCRIEPENNIEMILKAFSKTKNLNLVIIGNWGNSDFGENMRKAYSKFNNIFLLDPIYDQHILNQIRSNCYIYIHGHSAGGTNPSLVEAMYLELGIVAFGVNFNVATTENEGLYFNNEMELLNVIDNLHHDKIDLNNYKIKMKEIANRRYIWSIVASKYAEVF